MSWPPIVFIETSSCFLRVSVINLKSSVTWPLIVNIVILWCSLTDDYWRWQHIQHETSLYVLAIYFINWFVLTYYTSTFNIKIGVVHSTIQDLIKLVIILYIIYYILYIILYYIILYYIILYYIILYYIIV